MWTHTERYSLCSPQPMRNSVPRTLSSIHQFGVDISDSSHSGTTHYLHYAHGIIYQNSKWITIVIGQLHDQVTNWPCQPHTTAYYFLLSVCIVAVRSSIEQVFFFLLFRFQFTKTTRQPNFILCFHLANRIDIMFNRYYSIYITWERTLEISRRHSHSIKIPVAETEQETCSNRENQPFK